MKLIQRLWNAEPDISNLEPVKWGIDHEEMAINDFEAELEKRQVTEKVTKCGLFINRALPYFAVSPDGLFGDFLKFALWKSGNAVTFGCVLLL